LIVTGYGGFVAGSVVWQAVRSGEWDVYALSLIEMPEERERFHCIQFDLCYAAALEMIFSEIRPDAVVHTAALADIDYCQNNQAEAARVNVEATGHLARLCGEADVKMILCSTDTVFDGQKGMYTEEDAPHAVNFYAETKIAAERIVRETVKNGVVARLSLVMGLPVLGALPRRDALEVPSRHLGLVTAVEHGAAALAAVDAMAELVAEHVDLDAVVALAAPLPAGPAWDAGEEVGGVTPGRPVVGVFGGPAFTFGYAEHAEMLAAAGAEVVTVDPMNDRLPPGTDALIIGGGFPEEHVHALAANTPMLADVAAHARSGRPIHAECAGLLYLAHDLDGHTMAGVVDVRGHFGPTLTLGYRDAVALTDSALFAAGDRITGHEFHRSTVEAIGPIDHAWAWRKAGVVHRDGVAAGTVHASYLHTHPAGAPDSVARLVATAAAAAEGEDRHDGDVGTVLPCLDQSLT
ncbi:MAG: sugar nucleotide-binding protein, partial [Corynebacteriales bacterium]|nr:sugar nucleotide-binding protein [Mycobacteriales bacterium]